MGEENRFGIGLEKRMKAKKISKIIIDTVMLILLPLLMAYSFIGETAHEWLGLSMFLLFILHHIMNSAWLKMLKQSKRGISKMNRYLNVINTAAEAKRARTNCGRCKVACPAGIDIPAVIGAYRRYGKEG